MNALAPFVVFGIAVLVVWLALYTTVPVAWKVVLTSGNLFGSWLLRHPRFAPWFDARRSRFAGWSAYAPVAAIVAAGVVVTSVTVLAFLEIAEHVQERSPWLDDLDRRLHHLARQHRSDALTPFFDLAARVGGGRGLTVIVVIASGLLLVGRRKERAVYLVFTSAMGGLLNAALKLHYQRHRPDVSEALRTASGFSFPSGHAMGSVIVFSALAYLAVRQFRSWKLNALLVSLALCASTAISLSRIYLGVHWLSDITAGFVAGTLWVTTTTVAYEAFRWVSRTRRRAGRATEGGRSDRRTGSTGSEN